MTTDKHQKISLIGNNNNMPQIVKTGTTNVEAQDKKERGKALRQVVAAFVANIGTINTGLIFGFSAVVIPQLTAPTSSITVDESQASWIASLSSLSTPIGCILSGYLMDTIGRKKTLLITEIPLLLGWIVIASASNVGMIYAGRLLVGLGSGMVGAPARVYTSEVTQPHLRGMLCALSSVCLSFGVLFQYILGSVTSWIVLSAISACVPVIAFIGMSMMPETPNYLVSSQKPDKAIKSLAKLRGSSYNLQKEVENLQKGVAKAQTNNSQTTTGRDRLRALLEPSSMKPFAILFIYFMIYQFSGVNTITFYAVKIFQETGTSMDKYTCTMILGSIRLLFTIIACIALRRCGRRPLTFISSIGCGITMLGLGTYFYYKHQWDNMDPPQAPVHTWFPVACIYIYTVTCTVGFLVVPWVMIGELYPMKVRGIIGGFTTCSAHTFVFIVVKTYPFLTHLMERHGAFLLYGCISLLGTIFFYFYLPETKGKSLQEIEDYFSGRTTSLKSKKIDNQLLNNNTTKSLMEQDKLLATINEKK